MAIALMMKSRSRFCQVTFGKTAWTDLSCQCMHLLILQLEFQALLPHMNLLVTHSSVAIGTSKIIESFANDMQYPQVPNESNAKRTMT